MLDLYDAKKLIMDVFTDFHVTCLFCGCRGKLKPPTEDTIEDWLRRRQDVNIPYVGLVDKG